MLNGSDGRLVQSVRGYYDVGWLHSRQRLPTRRVRQRKPQPLTITVNISLLRLPTEKL